MPLLGKVKILLHGFPVGGSEGLAPLTLRSSGTPQKLRFCCAP